MGDGLGAVVPGCVGGWVGGWVGVGRGQVGVRGFSRIGLGGRLQALPRVALLLALALFALGCIAVRLPELLGWLWAVYHTILATGLSSARFIQWLACCEQ